MDFSRWGKSEADDFIKVKEKTMKGNINIDLRNKVINDVYTTTPVDGYTEIVIQITSLDSIRVTVPVDSINLDRIIQTVELSKDEWVDDENNNCITLSLLSKWCNELRPSMNMLDVITTIADIRFTNHDRPLSKQMLLSKLKTFDASSFGDNFISQMETIINKLKEQ